MIKKIINESIPNHHKIDENRYLDWFWGSSTNSRNTHTWPLVVFHPHPTTLTSTQIRFSSTQMLSGIVLWPWGTCRNSRSFNNFITFRNVRNFGNSRKFRNFRNLRNSMILNNSGNFRNIESLEILETLNISEPLETSYILEESLNTSEKIWKT